MWTRRSPSRAHWRHPVLFLCLLVEESKRPSGGKVESTIIFEAKLLALVLAFAVWRDRLDAVPLICFIDNNSARDLAISGAGRNLVAKALIGFLLKLEMAVCASPWYSRVPTPSNIADDPSRGEVQPFLSQGVEQLDPTEALGHILEVSFRRSGQRGVKIWMTSTDLCLISHGWQCLHR